MPAYTTILGLYKPGGGSTGQVTPDEVVDVDKLNQNFDRIDGAVGVGSWSTSTRPIAPFTNQAGYNATLDTLERWTGTTWVSIVPQALQGLSGGPYYTQAQLSAGALDSRYYTQAQLTGGQLDTRYVRGSQVNVKAYVGNGVSPTPTLDSTTNTYTATMAIDFTAAGFQNSPVVLASPQSADSGYMNIGITAQASGTGATLILRRRNAVATGYWWLAIGS